MNYTSPVAKSHMYAMVNYEVYLITKILAVCSFKWILLKGWIEGTDKENPLISPNYRVESAL
jgi:hypothetical protein